jgi:hypothetical protein
VTALPVIADVYRCTVHWANVAGGQPVEALNVLHFRTTEHDEEEISTILAANLAAHADEALRCLSVSFALRSIDVLPLDGSTATQTFSMDGTNGQGGSDYIPQGAVVVSLHTGIRGPKGRGRIYVGPCGEAEQNKGDLSGNAATTAAGWNAIKTALDGLELFLVVASYVHGVANGVSSISCDTRLRTQRRRAG